MDEQKRNGLQVRGKLIFFVGVLYFNVIFLLMKIFYVGFNLSIRLIQFIKVLIQI